MTYFIGSQHITLLMYVFIFTYITLCIYIYRITIIVILATTVSQCIVYLIYILTVNYSTRRLTMYVLC